MASKSNQDAKPADAAASSSRYNDGLKPLRGEDKVPNPEPSKEELKGPLVQLRGDDKVPKKDQKKATSAAP